MASPATRRRAREAGIDLAQVAGTGPSGRITREDFGGRIARAATPGAAHSARGAAPAAAAHWDGGNQGHRPAPSDRAAHERGETQHSAFRLRRGSRRHRARVAAPTPERSPARGRAVAYVPAIPGRRAGARARDSSRSATRSYDAERSVLVRHNAVHAGIATQTPDGLKVPVVRHAEARALWDLAAEIRRVSEAARTNKATREELSGLDHHRHQPRQAGRHRLDADHQRARGRDHRRQQGRGASRRDRRRGRGAAA